MGLRLQRAVLQSTIRPDLRFLAMVLALYADDDGTNIFPALKTLADNLGTTESSVKRKRRALVDAGVLTKDGGGFRGRTARYRFNLARLGEKERARAPLSDDARHEVKEATPAPLSEKGAYPCAPFSTERSALATEKGRVGAPILPRTTNEEETTRQERQLSPKAARQLVTSRSRAGQSSAFEGIVLDGNCPLDDDVFSEVFSSPFTNHEDEP